MPTIKNIVIVLVLVLVCVAIFWWAVGWGIIVRDQKRDKERAERFYLEQTKKYDSSKEVFRMNYIYNIKTNIGFAKDDCFERYIVDAWSSERVAFISMCQDEKVTKEKLDALSSFWKEYEDIFKSK